MSTKGGSSTDLSKVTKMTCPLGLDLPSPMRILQTRVDPELVYPESLWMLTARPIADT